MDLPMEFPPILGTMINDPTPGCLSRFLVGSESCKAALLRHLRAEWLSEDTEGQYKFVVLTATPHRAAELRKDLTALRNEILIQGPDATTWDQLRELRNIDIQPAAEFLHSNSNPRGIAPHIIIVDTLFPDLSAWHFAVYISLQIWADRIDHVSAQIRMCLLRPKPSSWGRKCPPDVHLHEHTRAPDMHEDVIPNCTDPEIKIAEAVISKLRVIAGVIGLPRVLIIGAEKTLGACIELSLQQSDDWRWSFNQLPPTRQQEYAARMHNTGQPLVFYSSEISSVTCTIGRLSAIISISDQKRPVFRPRYQGTPIKAGAMSTGEIEYSCALLMKSQIDDYTPALYQIRLAKEASEPKRQLLFHPLVAIFLITGIVGTVQLHSLSGPIESCTLNIDVGEYVNHLIELSFLTVTQKRLSGDWIAPHGSQARQTFDLMLATGRTDLEFCTLEVGLYPVKDMSRVTIDVTRGLNHLIPLLRPRLGRPEIFISLKGRNIDEVITQDINALLPTHLHSWIDKGVPWLFALLYSLMKQKCQASPDEGASALTDNEWFQLTPDIEVQSNFLKSLWLDTSRLADRSGISGPLFRLENDLDAEGHVNACYEEIMRRLMDHFPTRLVAITSTIAGLRGFELYTEKFHEILRHDQNAFALRRRPEISTIKDTVFGLYFTITISRESSTIGNILVVPRNVVFEWARRQASDFEPSAALLSAHLSRSSPPNT